MRVKNKYPRVRGFTQHLRPRLFASSKYLDCQRRSNSAVSAGFTIVELLIATSVFSVVLMTALAGFLSIGRLFYQGVSSTQTADAANQLLSGVVGNFQTANNVTASLSVNGYTYYCIGNNRYTYNLGKQVGSSAIASHAAPPAGNYSLLKDVLPGSDACATPSDDINTGVPSPPGSVRFNNPVELLGNNMRLNLFTIQSIPSISPNFYNVSIVVAYGDDELLEYTNPSDLSTVSCKPGSSAQQFCAISRLSTGIYRGQGQ